MSNLKQSMSEASRYMRYMRNLSRDYDMDLSALGEAVSEMDRMMDGDAGDTDH